METRVLIVEDESIVALDLEHRLTAMGFAVVGTAGTAPKALELVAADHPDVVLMDIQLRGEMDGIHAAELVQRDFDIPVIFLTAFSDAQSLDRAKRSQAYGYLLKPFQERELSIAIELALFKHSAEQELRQNRALLGVTLNNIAEGVITTDHDNNVVLMNATAEQILGVTLEDVLGTCLDDILTTMPLTGATGPDQWQTLRSRQGLNRTVAITANSLEKDGATGGSRVMVIRDVSRELEYQNRLVAAKDAAEAAATAKSDFLSRVSHELRTPLNSIIGMADLALHSDVPQETAEHLQILRGSAHRLNGLIGDVLDYARYDAGRMTIRKDIFDPVAVLEQAVRQHAAELMGGELRCVTVVDPATPRSVYGDQQRITQILGHLLSNALKFTSSGHVVVELTCAPGPVLRITVEDTGPGIPGDQQAVIFEDFSQLESPATRTADGVGIGLAIVRRLVRAMEGSLGVKSRDGEGSRFTVEIPVTVAQEQPEQVEPDVTEASPSIRRLITDDSLVARAWHPWCEVLGVACETVTAEELGAFPEATDLRVSTSSSPGSCHAQVLLSPLRFPSDREDSCTDALLLQEPVEMERIRTLLVHGVPTDLQRESPAPAATDVKPRGRAVSAGFSVLLVDDDRSNLVVHQKLLEGMGHTVEAVGNAKAALRSFGHRQFDAAIMDIEMPHMNGWELSSRLREHTAGQHTVLVALTAHDYADIEDRARESSFDAVLSKPASPERIDAVLREHVATRGHSDQELIRKINDAVEAGRIKEATGYLSDLRRATTSAGVAESAFRLLLALRRADTGAIHTLMTKLQKELRA